MSDDPLAALVDEGRARLDQARRTLTRLVAGDDESGWHAPLEALLAMVDEVVAGAGALAAGETPDGEARDELGAALDELRYAVAGLVERMAALAGEEATG